MIVMIKRIIAYGRQLSKVRTNPKRRIVRKINFSRVDACLSFIESIEFMKQKRNECSN